MKRLTQFALWPMLKLGYGALILYFTLSCVLSLIAGLYIKHLYGVSTALTAAVLAGCILPPLLILYWYRNVIGANLFDTVPVLAQLKAWWYLDVLKHKPSEVFKTGVVRDKTDARDFKFSAPPKMSSAPAAVLPGSVDMRADVSPIFNQGSIGSCVANAIAGCYSLIVWRKTKYQMGKAERRIVSRLMLYYYARKEDGSLPQDIGCMPRSALKMFSTIGNALETSWPYVISKMNDMPPASVLSAALKYKLYKYESLPQKVQGKFPYATYDIDKACEAIASGLGVVISLALYSGFFTADCLGRNGRIPVPFYFDAAGFHQVGTDEGGHCIYMIGYNKTDVAVGKCPPRHFICVNSWGAGYHDGGICYLPFDYFASPFCWDAWVPSLAPLK